jgi:uroporphyrinogen-III synthase
MTPWRIANTRDEPANGPLARALAAAGLVSLACPVLAEGPASDTRRLSDAVASLAGVSWLVVASARSVRALRRAGLGAWPAGLRSAAVGAATARALTDAGAAPPPVVGAGDGAEALWDALRARGDWAGVRVLVATTGGGRTLLEDRLREAGARVEVVEAYLMAPRPADDIRADWRRASADAVVLTSPRAATTLADAVGRDTLDRLSAIIAIGRPTADALSALGLRAAVPPRADFTAAATLAATLARETHDR